MPPRRRGVGFFSDHEKREISTTQPTMGWWRSQCLRFLSRPLPLLPLFATLAIVAEPTWATEPAIVATSAAWCATVLYNVPSAARVMHTRPTYLEDVECPFDEHESAEEREMRHGFRNAFNHVVIVTTSVSLGAVVEYGLYRFHDSHLELLELAGVVGGLISLFSDIHVTIGKVLIMVLHHRRAQYTRRKARRVRELELRAVGVRAGAKV